NDVTFGSSISRLGAVRHLIGIQDVIVVPNFRRPAQFKDRPIFFLGNGANFHFFGGRSRREDGYGVLLGCCIRKQLAGNYRGSEKQMTDKRGRDKKSSAGDHRERKNAPPE